MFTVVIKRFYYFIPLSIILLLSACSSNSPLQQSSVLSKKTHIQQTLSQRNQQMQRLLHWRIKGKIAFIEKNKMGKYKRKSASLRWDYQANTEAEKIKPFQQQIDLTTFMGINILHVESYGQQHSIKVDGKKYQGSNLNYMIYNLTGLNLPTQALPYWLKGIAYNKQDKIIYNEVTNLPKILNSIFVKPSIQTLAKESFVQQQLMRQKQINNQTWQVKYSHYKNFSGHQLATRMTITHQELTIKIAINTWSLL
ncbi:MAG: outer membrane lipoprotein LolB [Alteromonadaceae bacterium]|nr:outer membrane lipoprotein LolB [Alteromonadaceae bacterium]